MIMMMMMMIILINHFRSLLIYVLNSTANDHLLAGIQNTDNKINEGTEETNTKELNPLLLLSRV
jgi:hypothetical protein